MVLQRQNKKLWNQNTLPKPYCFLEKHVKRCQNNQQIKIKNSKENLRIRNFRRRIKDEDEKMNKSVQFSDFSYQNQIIQQFS